MRLTIPKRLAATCRRSPDRKEWLSNLPTVVDRLCSEWSLDLGAPFDNSGAGWVTPDRNRLVVLKVGMPHMEADQEIAGMRFWNGEGTARVIEHDEACNAMLLERCEPGTPLREVPEPEQDIILTGLLKRLWQIPPAPHPFRPLSEMTASWSASARRRSKKWFDPGIVEEGLRLFEELPRTADRNVLLATDLHAGNVLAAHREPWLVIDPKPFIGDPAYDVTQHLFNTERRLLADPDRTIRRVADLLEIDYERVCLWVFARAAIDPPGGPRQTVHAFIRSIAP